MQIDKLQYKLDSEEIPRRAILNSKRELTFTPDYSPKQINNDISNFSNEDKNQRNLSCIVQQNNKENLNLEQFSNNNNLDFDDLILIKDNEKNDLQEKFGEQENNKKDSIENTTGNNDSIQLKEKFIKSIINREDNTTKEAHK